MEHLTSRKNPVIQHLRRLGSDSGYRTECGEYVLDGEKLLREALTFGGEVQCVLWADAPGFPAAAAEQYTAPADLVAYASPLKHSPGPVFSVRRPVRRPPESLRSAILLENVQDPGNVGTVIRTANALGTDAVLLVGDCASPYSAKTARAAMGALFRQCVLERSMEDALALLKRSGLRLYGAALSDRAADVRQTDLKNAAVAVGSEGQGLSRELLERCDGELIIPMAAGSESLNAAVAAGILLWELYKSREREN